MRIDKFLWYIRYFKTRSIATEECKKNKVWINSIIIKPSREVMVSDKITIRKDQVNYEIEIIQLPPNRLGAKLVALYVKDITPKEELDGLKLRMLSQEYYRNKGLGRPTKKDRRDLDGYIEEVIEED